MPIKKKKVSSVKTSALPKSKMATKGEAKYPQPKVIGGRMKRKGGQPTASNPNSFTRVNKKGPVKVTKPKKKQKSPMFPGSGY